MIACGLGRSITTATQDRCGKRAAPARAYRWNRRRRWAVMAAPRTFPANSAGTTAAEKAPASDRARTSSSRQSTHAARWVAASGDVPVRLAVEQPLERGLGRLAAGAGGVGVGSRVEVGHGPARRRFGRLLGGHHATPAQMGQDFQPGPVQPRLDRPDGPPVGGGDLLVRPAPARGTGRTRSGTRPASRPRPGGSRRPSRPSRPRRRGRPSREGSRPTPAGLARRPIQVRQRLTAIPKIHGRSGRVASHRRSDRNTRRNVSWVTSSASCRWVSRRTHRPNTSAWNRSISSRMASACPLRQRRTRAASSAVTAAPQTGLPGRRGAEFHTPYFAGPPWAIVGFVRGFGEHRRCRAPHGVIQLRQSEAPPPGRLRPPS